MHLPSESIHGAVCPVTAALAAVGITVAAYLVIKNKEKRPSLGFFALTTLSVFLLQALNYALPGNYSGHLLGALLAGALLGLPAGILSVSVVITVQCLAFADGGVEQLGANLLNMAVIATTTGTLFAQYAQKRLGAHASVIAGGILSVLAAVTAVIAELYVGGYAGESLNAAVTTLLVSHLPIALVEGAATWGLLRLQLFTDVRRQTYALATIALAALLLVPLASSLPDALETALASL